MRKDCYIDVVEIHPETVGYSSSLIYCTCKLADGSTVWMEISNESFVEYLDSEANANDLKYTARNITYDTPVRLSGTLSTTNTKLNPSSDADTTNVFKFVTADKVESRMGGKRVSREVVYTEDVAINAPTYVDIVSINPKYTDTNLYLATTGVLCECTTADGDIVWIYVDAEK